MLGEAVVVGLDDFDRRRDGLRTVLKKQPRIGHTVFEAEGAAR